VLAPGAEAPGYFQTCLREEGFTARLKNQNQYGGAGSERHSRCEVPSATFCDVNLRKGMAKRL